MKILSFSASILTAALFSAAHAQVDSVQLRYAATITQADLREHLGILASDAYEGRETGMKGQKMAAAYLREQFIRYGIPPVPGAAARNITNGYEQSFPLEITAPGGLGLVTDGRVEGFMQDFFYLSEKLQEDHSSDTIVFCGYGRRNELRNDFASPALRGHVALVMQEPFATAGKGATPSTGLIQELSRKAEAAQAAGARVMLFVCTDARALMNTYAHYIMSPRMKLGNGVKKEAARPALQTFLIDRSMAERILKRGQMSWKKAVRKAKRPGTVIASRLEVKYAPRVENLTGENILGYVEGTDLKNELVVITAHYDHIGMHDKDVYNGADDDGSGTVAVLELAQAFALAKAQGHGPRRSMLFMPVSGEEKGLLGSEWYSEHPVFPLDSTITDLNIDMIGRTDSAHTNSAPYVYIIGSDRLSTELHAINERANATYTQLVLDQTFNSENDPNRFYFRSDHYNFAKHGVPVIFYFNGVHEDYHQPGDEVEKIRFDLLEQRARLVFHTAWELAGRDQRPLVDKPIPVE
jgi:hypothetical protein